jgi:alginate O-acetyltransferase complex protein AlgJ
MMVLAGAVGLWSAFQIDWRAQLGSGFVDGETQIGLQAAFEGAVIHRTVSINLWSSFRYGFLSEAAVGAVVGRAGWLFSDEEYLATPDFDARLEKSLDRIAAAQNALAQHDIALILALVPDKARIVADKLRRPRPQVVEARYAQALAGLLSRGVHAVDLAQVLARLPQGAPAFLMRDTHWTPAGAHAVARVLAPEIREATQLRSAFEMRATGTIENSGDLLAFINAGPIGPWLGLAPLQVTQFKVFPKAGSIGLFDESPQIGTYLVGTSFSANEDWNFLGFLKLESETDILNMAQAGAGPFLPMEELLASDTLRKNAIRAVVWEVPERYLTLAEKQE